MSRFLASLFVIVLGLAVQAQQPSPQAKQTIDYARVEAAALAEMEAAGVPGAVILIVRGDAIEFAKGLGVASVEVGDAVTPDHLFRIGSTTKMFVGAALAKLAGEGKLKLDKPSGEVIPSLPPRLAAITPHQLLTHTSGLADDLAMFGPHDEAMLAASIRRWTPERLFTKPGDVYSYSNPGYWLAGHVAETAAGKLFADVLADDIFQPLGMQRTTFRPMLAITYPVAQGHEVKDGKPAIIRPAANNAAAWPAGSMYSSANDLARFAIAMLNDGRIDGKQAIPAEVLKTISTPHVADAGSRGHYGYGLAIRTVRGVQVVGHGGSRSGYGSEISFVPSERLAMIVLANRTGASLPKTKALLLELLIPAAKAAVPETEAAMAPEELKQFAGEYRNGTATMELVMNGDSLALAGGNQPLKAIGGNRFRTAGGTIIHLIRGNDGETRYVYRGGRALRRQDD